MAQLNIMYSLQRNGEMTMSRLADVLGVSLSSATGLVDRIEERGYIERTRVPEDRRVVLVHVTEAGTRMLQENDALSDELMRDVLARLDPAELPVIARAVGEVRAALEATAAQPARNLHETSTPGHDRPRRSDPATRRPTHAGRTPRPCPEGGMNGTHGKPARLLRGAARWRMIRRSA